MSAAKTVTISDGKKLYRVGKTKFLQMLLRIANDQPHHIDMVGTDLGEAEYEVKELVEDKKKVLELIASMSDASFTPAPKTTEPPPAPVGPPTDTIVKK